MSNPEPFSPVDTQHSILCWSHLDNIAAHYQIEMHLIQKILYCQILATHEKITEKSVCSSLASAAIQLQFFLSHFQWIIAHTLTSFWTPDRLLL